MRLSSILLVLLLAACGGRVVLPSDNESSGGSGGGGSSGTAGGGATGGAPGTAGGSTGTTAPRCSPGNYVFCRCPDRSDGTKLCRDDGASFEPCSCNVDTPPDCVYAMPSNPPGCPVAYSYLLGGEACATLDLECSYPGEGDAQSDGCFATALLACRIQPGGAQRWTVVR